LEREENVEPNPVDELVMFNGTVMRGQPDHQNLAAARFVRDVETAPHYRLFSIGDRYPAMIRDDLGGVSIPGELYHVAPDVWPSIRDAEPPGLYRGAVELADGTWVDGMLGSEELVAAGVDITAFGGWAEYVRQTAVRTRPDRAGRRHHDRADTRPG
jgi:AGZA family xanthine/uracil permease-like MFS transporter